MRPATISLATALSVLLVFTLTSTDQSQPHANQLLVMRQREKRELNPYYDFLINEWSFKFWAVFQLVTIAVLFYSTFAAIYYAKYTYLHTPPSDDDLFIRKRSLESAIRKWGNGRIRDRPNSRNK